MSEKKHSWLPFLLLHTRYVSLLQFRNSLCIVQEKLENIRATFNLHGKICLELSEIFHQPHVSGVILELSICKIQNIINKE